MNACYLGRVGISFLLNNSFAPGGLQEDLCCSQATQVAAFPFSISGFGLQ